MNIHRITVGFVTVLVMVCCLVLGGFTGNVIFPVPNAGTGNILTGQIFQNTATTVTVADGTPGNTTTVTQSNNELCP